MNLLEFSKLPRRERGREARCQSGWNLDLRGSFRSAFVREFFGSARFVLLQDATTALFKHRAQRVKTRPETANLRWVETDGVGEFALGEAAARAVHQHVVEHRVGGIARRRARRSRAP